MYRQVILSFKSLKQAKIILFADNVILKMDGITTYFIHQNDVDALKISATAYKNAFHAASNHGKLLNMAKDTTLRDLKKQLTVVAYSVDDVAKGDIIYIIGAGFETRSKAQRLKTLPAPTNFKAYNLQQNGSLFMTWDKVKKRTSYIVEMRVVGEEHWQTVASPTATSWKIHNLKRGLHVEIRVCTVGTKNIKSGYTQIIDVFVD